MRNVLRGNANLVALLMTIAKGVKNAINKSVLDVVTVGALWQFAQEANTVTLMTKFALDLVNMIRIVLVAINARAPALVLANV